MLQLDLTQAQSSIPTPIPQEAGEKARQSLLDGSCPGSDFTGWVRLPRDYDREEFSRIQTAARRIQGDSQALVVIGIGGSYLGARAVLELLKSPNYNLLPKDTPDVYFIGNGLSGDAIAETIQLIGDKDWSINVISKSGTTLEPALAFRMFRSLLEKKYGKEGARSRIYATTDKARGVLKTQADAERWESFVVPDEVGGRYSVLTAVGLLPLAAAGVDIQALMDGAAAQMDECLNDPDSAAVRYARARAALYQAGKKIEVLAFPEPSFRFFCEWWKQLYAESEGKDGKGLFPAGAGAHRRSALHRPVPPGRRAGPAGDGGVLRTQPQCRGGGGGPGRFGRAELCGGQDHGLRGPPGPEGNRLGPRGRRRAQLGGHPAPSGMRTAWAGSSTSSSSPAPSPGCSSGSTPSTSRGWRTIRKICSPCWESRVPRNGGPSWKPA